jgi:hypothetical protein
MKLRNALRNLPFRREAAAARATPGEIRGSAVTATRTYAPNYKYRKFTPAKLADDLTAPPIASALSGMTRFAFAGVDLVPTPLEEGDDTQHKKIDRVSPVIEKLDARIGQVGMKSNAGSLGLIKGAYKSGAAFGKAIIEYSTIREDNFINFDIVQLLPAESFNSAPAGSIGFKSDAILPGIGYDLNERSVRYFQNAGMGKTIELDPEQIIFIQDDAVAENTSLLMAIAPTLEKWRAAADYGMIAAHRVSVPNMQARVEGKVIAEILKYGGEISPADVLAHAEDIVENQGYDEAVAVPAGMSLNYPNARVALDPWKIEDQLLKEILNFWFNKDVLESLQQAVSVSSAPQLSLLDRRISYDREMYGLPVQHLWDWWFMENGFDLRMEFNWWSWSPEDQQQAAENTRADFRDGIIDLNEARTARGLPALNPKEKEAFFRERRIIDGASDAEEILAAGTVT